MSDKSVPADKIGRLAEVLVDETLAMSDDEILAALPEDWAATEIAMRADIADAIASHRRQRLVSAKQAVAARRVTSVASRLRPSDLRAAITKAIAIPANDGSALTLAAREGRDVPDEDLEGLAQDLAELGIEIGSEKDPDSR